MEGKHVARNKQIQRQTVITLKKHKKTKGEQHERHKKNATEPSCSIVLHVTPSLLPSGMVKRPVNFVNNGGKGDEKNLR